MTIDWTALTVFVLLFALVTFLGFFASRWRKGDLDLLHEWGLGGRRFGTLVTWFLIGGDLYTAYTFVAVPALMFGAGALGFFAVPYTIMIYPILYLVFPRLWSVAHKRGYVTSADFVRGRFGNRWLALAVALTGILATMPYIALQLVGIQVVIGAMGVETSGLFGDLPLIIAFVILAAFTYSSGLRAPAMIAVVKDVLIYVTVIAAIIAVPLRLGGYGRVFSAVPAAKLLAGNAAGRFAGVVQRLRHPGTGFGLCPVPVSALDHRHIECVQRAGGAPERGDPARLLAAAGTARAGRLHGDRDRRADDAGVRRGVQTHTATTFLCRRSSWRCFQAGSSAWLSRPSPSARWCRRRSCRSPPRTLLPATFIASSSIRHCTHAQESQVAKVVSLVIKAGALAFIFFLPLQYALWLQLLGGVWIIQTLPSVILGLYTRLFHGWALLIGWMCGFGLGTWMVVGNNYAPVYPLHILGVTVPCYIALTALAVNLAVSSVLSLVFNMIASDRANDSTVAEDYV